MSDHEEDEDEPVDLFAFQELRDAEEAFEEEGSIQPLAPALAGGRDMSSANLVPYAIVPMVEANAVRPEYSVVDNVAYYNHVSKLVLTYGQTMHGIKAGAIFEEQNKQKIKFDF